MVVTPRCPGWLSAAVSITGQVPSRLIGYDAFQEPDITGLTLPITKHNYLVTRAEDIAGAIHEAFFIAASGRPGPVLIDITKDAPQGKATWTPPRGEPRRRGYRPHIPAPVSEHLFDLQCGDTQKQLVPTRKLLAEPLDSS